MFFEFWNFDIIFELSNLKNFNTEIVDTEIYSKKLFFLHTDSTEILFSLHYEIEM